MLIGFLDKNREKLSLTDSSIEKISSKVGELLGGHSGGAIAESATENNYLTHTQKEERKQKLKDCGSDQNCKDKWNLYFDELDRLQDGWLLGLGMIDESMAESQTDKLYESGYWGSKGLIRPDSEYYNENTNYNAIKSVVDNPGIEIGKSVLISAADYELGKTILGNVEKSYSLGEVVASNLGPAGTLTVPVDTTSTLKTTGRYVYKVTGGAASTILVGYDLYLDYDVFGPSKEFAGAALADLSAATILTIGSAKLSQKTNMPGYAIVIGGSIIGYFVNKDILNPFKEILKK